MSSLSISDWLLDFNIGQQNLSHSLAKATLIKEMKVAFSKQLRLATTDGMIYLGHDRDLIYQTLAELLEFMKT